MKPNILILMVFYLLIQSCSSQMPSDPDSIDRIDFYAIRRGVDFAQGVYSISELKDKGRDTIITDRVFIHRFVEELNQLIPDKHQRLVDYRSGAILFNREGDSTLVFFGERTGIIYRNQKMMDRDSLFRLIDDSVFATQPYDYWFPSDSSRDLYRNVVKTMMELRKQQAMDSLEIK